MANKSYEILKRRQKVHIKAYSVLCLILIFGLGFYLYHQWGIYTGAKHGIIANENLSEVLKERSTSEKAAFYENKDDFDALSEEISEKLTDIFPADDDYTSLTRQLDSYESELSKRNNPFEVSNINYQEMIEEENYSILPFKMNIRSSRENFTKFLHMVENSGSLNNQLRLMDVSSIRLNFDNDESEMITFTVQINAYFQKTNS